MSGGYARSALAPREPRTPRLLLVRPGDPAQHALGLLSGQTDQRRLPFAALRELGELALAGQPVLRDRLGLDLDRDVPVAAHARAGRDQLPDDHVLLQTEQR